MVYIGTVKEVVSKEYFDFFCRKLLLAQQRTEIIKHSVVNIISNAFVCIFSSYPLFLLISFCLLFCVGLD